MHLNKPRKVAIARKIGYSEYDPRKPEKEHTLIVQIHQCLIEVSDRSRLACLYVSQAQKDGLGSLDTSVPLTSCTMGFRNMAPYKHSRIDLKSINLGRTAKS